MGASEGRAAGHWGWCAQVRKAQELCGGNLPPWPGWGPRSHPLSLSLPTLPKCFHLGHWHLPAKLGLARAALWSGQTAPGDGAGLARHLSDGLPRWVRPELRLAPGLTGQRPQGPGPALCTTPQQHRLRHPRQALLLAQLGQGAGGEGRRRRGVLHSGGASLEGKRGSWASFPLHLVPLWLDGDAKWQALRARLGHFMPVWRS